MSYGQIGPIQISHETGISADILVPDIEHHTIFWREVGGTMTLFCKENDGTTVSVLNVVAGIRNVTCGGIRG